jgi:hypothetical protein
MGARPARRIRDQNSGNAPGDDTGNNFDVKKKKSKKALKKTGIALNRGAKNEKNKLEKCRGSNCTVFS